MIFSGRYEWLFWSFFCCPLILRYLKFAFFKTNSDKLTILLNNSWTWKSSKTTKHSRVKSSNYKMHQQEGPCFSSDEVPWPDSVFSFSFNETAHLTLLLPPIHSLRIFHFPFIYVQPSALWTPSSVKCRWMWTSTVTHKMTHGPVYIQDTFTLFSKTANVFLPLSGYISSFHPHAEHCRWILI